MALGAPEDFEIFDYFLYHFESIAAEQLFITIVFQTKNKKIFHSTLINTRTASKRQKINPLRTRSSSDYFLIGNFKTSIGGTKLPTLRQIFQYVLYLQELSLDSYPVRMHCPCSRSRAPILADDWNQNNWKTIC